MRDAIAAKASTFPIAEGVHDGEGLGCRIELQEATGEAIVSLGILHGDQLDSASLCPTILPGMDNLGRW